jgi:hypothetical protein
MENRQVWMTRLNIAFLFVLLLVHLTCLNNIISGSDQGIWIVWITLQVAIGLVVALDYKNPYLSPYEEYQVRLLLQTAFLQIWIYSAGEC